MVPLAAALAMTMLGADAEAPRLTASLSAYTYFVAHGPDYVQPTLRVDRDWLHLEARYNYEDLGAGSLWFGWNFSLGKELRFDATPMIGGVFRNARGIAPGYELSLRYRLFELSTEGEYLFDFRDRSNDFFYSWSELSAAPTNWLRFGLAAQRTHAYRSRREVQPGAFLGLSFHALSGTFYVFNWDEPTYVVAVSLSAN